MTLPLLFTPSALDEGPPSGGLTYAQQAGASIGKFSPDDYSPAWIEEIRMPVRSSEGVLFFKTYSHRDQRAWRVTWPRGAPELLTYLGGLYGQTANGVALLDFVVPKSSPVETVQVWMQLDAEELRGAQLGAATARFSVLLVERV